MVTIFTSKVITMELWSILTVWILVILLRNWILIASCQFLDAQRIYNLTSYLQELHSRGLANADHTTLLLNCYTKLKDVSRLDEFIKVKYTQSNIISSQTLLKYA
jgi:hypothetical protein